ncbi:protein SnodProt1 precursor [Acrodontium crateriforme]|uniref:Protein SnodProt1 n=1 Tax=Acrodontium crateriforme TaxID=150365 RepID=A0AAQ3R7Z6_9PEZI|nr:protein SnodProt1 precursor [Acrodontium crateriforme]
MRLSTGTLLILSFVSTVLCMAVTYDGGYDSASRPMTAVACGGGIHGLDTRYGWKKQSDIPTFPFIGGGPLIKAWNSPSCGECMAVTFNGTTVHMIVIDHAAPGLDMGKHALDMLTHGEASSLGHVEATVESVPVSNCGIQDPKREIHFTA